MVERDGWHFTNNGKYTVKSGYQIERVYLDRERPPLMFEPTVDALKAFCWKIRCPPPPKVKTFSMAIGDMLYSSQEESEGARNTRRHMLCTLWSG